MKKTDNYYYNMPERDDRVKVDDLNQNAKKIDMDVAELDVQLRSKAPKFSPRFSGEPMAIKIGTIDKFERIITIGTLTDALEVEVL